jgi:aspartyl-tRNA(Asn)/glutamyl-tRNA(Gln) amidotransferase subunit A
MNEITSCSLRELRQALQEKKVSSVEVSSAFLKRSEKLKHLNALISISNQEYLEQELKRVSLQPDLLLSGIPVCVKDLILTKTQRTTAASKILSNFIAPYDATVIKNLNSSGAYVLSKANLDEFAMGSSNETSFFGPAFNPWDESCVPGGSSGGSAIAVSAGLAPVALGTDTGGSVRQPASFCNLVGFKPTYGRVSRYGVIAYASSLDQVGVFARDVEDCALVLNSISGHDPKDSTSYPNAKISIPDFSKFNLKDKKIGLPKECFVKGIDEEVLALVNNVAKTCEQLGAKIVEISLPHIEVALATYYIIAPAEASSNLSRYDGIRYGYRTNNASNLKEIYSISRSEGFGKEVKRRIMLGSFVLSTGYYDAYYRKAQKVRALLKNDFDKSFKKQCDFILTPTSPIPPFKIGEKTADPLTMYLADVMTIPVNLAGLPAMNLPCGFNSNKLPVGVQLIAKQFGDEDLLCAGYAYQQATSWHKQLPLN